MAKSWSIIKGWYDGAMAYWIIFIWSWMKKTSIILYAHLLSTVIKLIFSFFFFYERKLFYIILVYIKYNIARS